MMISDRKLSKRVKRLGATNLETVKETAERQADLLCRLRDDGCDDAYIGLNDCRPDNCGLVRCSAGCWFGLRRRWLNGVLSAHKLFIKLAVPLYEVRIIHEAWHRPLGELSSMKVQLAKQFARRRLDARNGRQTIMIGSYKAANSPYADRWMGEIHAVAGRSDAIRLRQAFSLPLGEGDNYMHVGAVDDLATTLIEALRPDVRVWQPPYADEPIKAPGKKQRAEFYRWQLRLKPDERLFRYGCDRYYRPIEKSPRSIMAKAKKRPYPYWLEPTMYGSHPMTCKCRMCMTKQ